MTGEVAQAALNFLGLAVFFLFVIFFPCVHLAYQITKYRISQSSITLTGIQAYVSQLNTLWRWSYRLYVGGNETLVEHLFRLTEKRKMPVRGNYLLVALFLIPYFFVVAFTLMISLLPPAISFKGITISLSLALVMSASLAYSIKIANRVIDFEML